MSQSHALYVLKLRRNIALEGDLALARMELEALIGSPAHDLLDVADLAGGWPELHATRGLLAAGACCRVEGQQGYAVRAPLALLGTLIARSSFLQAIYCLPMDPADAAPMVSRLRRDLGPVVRLAGRADSATELLYAVPHYLLLELSAVVARGTRTPEEVRHQLPALLAALLGETDDTHALRLAESALAARSTTSHLAHDLHYYKAKFFPRMARALVNICAERTGSGEHRVLDNFAGSGTTLLESALLGLPSTGLDLDPLSVLIARAKLETMRVGSARLAEEAARFPRTRRAGALATARVSDTVARNQHEAIVFPPWLLRNRKMTARLAAELADDIAAVRVGVEQSAPELRGLIRVVFSDAIARKVRLRFLGTGVGRFSLTVNKTPLAEAVSRGIERSARAAAAREWLEATLQLRPARSEARIADARHLPADLGLFDVLVTSPPYLPASSGRESYTKGRALSLIALGLSDALSVDDLVDSAVGSMDAAEADAVGLTLDEAELVGWLRADSLRRIKAAPTGRYFLDMRRSLQEMRRVLTPGGRAAVVSGKISTFYQFATRQPLYVAPVADMLADEAARAGFAVEGMHDIQLHKANRNARPRSLDAYYETVILLRQPE